MRALSCGAPLPAAGTSGEELALLPGLRASEHSSSSGPRGGRGLAITMELFQR